MLCRIFLHKKLASYKWAAVLVTTVGIIIVGLADVFPNPLDKNSSESDPASAAKYKSSFISIGAFRN